MPAALCASVLIFCAGCLCGLTSVGGSCGFVGLARPVWPTFAWSRRPCRALETFGGSRLRPPCALVRVLGLPSSLRRWLWTFPLVFVVSSFLPSSLVACGARAAAQPPACPHKTASVPSMASQDRVASTSPFLQVPPVASPDLPAFVCPSTAPPAPSPFCALQLSSAPDNLLTSVRSILHVIYPPRDRGGDNAGACASCRCFP